MKKMLKKILGINKPVDELSRAVAEGLTAGIERNGPVMVLDDKSTDEYFKHRTYAVGRSPEHIERMKDSRYTTYKPLTEEQKEALKQFKEQMTLYHELQQKKKEKDTNLRNKVKSLDDIRKEYMLNDIADTRYNEPKTKPKASEELIEDTIDSTEIYRRAKGLILNAQRKQVGYGLDKYPEPLNADTWSTIETIDHIIDESIDKLHYLVMLRIKLEKEYGHNQGKKTTCYVDGAKYELDPEENRYREKINHAVSDALKEYNVHKEVLKRNDGLDSIRYAVDHYLRHKE